MPLLAIVAMSAMGGRIEKFIGSFGGGALADFLKFVLLFFVLSVLSFCWILGAALGV